MTFHENIWVSQPLYTHKKNAKQQNVLAFNALVASICAAT